MSDYGTVIDHCRKCGCLTHVGYPSLLCRDCYREGERSGEIPVDEPEPDDVLEDPDRKPWDMREGAPGDAPPVMTNGQCRADRDGDCDAVDCPQKTNRQVGCPLYNWDAEDRL